MRPFSKNESIAVIAILAVVVGISLINFKVSLRRARDAQRKDSLASVAGALQRYMDDFGAFPLSTSDGKMVACKGPDTKLDAKGNLVNLIPCEWGKDPLVDVMDSSYPPYLSVFPPDPQADMGIRFVYFSNTKRFQLLGALESSSEDEYEETIIARGINCGTKICNFGRGYADTPLDKSIEEYENELLEKSNEKN